METSDQKSFWKEIGKIGIGQERKKEIPCEVKLINGEVSSKLDDVLEVWKTGFENLLNCNNNQSDFPDMPQERENYYNFDADISITELKLAIKSLKCNKAVGIDDLPAPCESFKM